MWLVDLRTFGKKWFAIQVKSKCEPAVAQALRQKGYEDFLPLYRIRKQWSDRWKEIELPLFAGYVFCRFSLEETRAPIVTTPGVVKILGAGQELTPISDIEIDNVRAVLNRKVEATPCRYGQIGDKVRVIFGPLTGVEGILTAHRKRFQLVLSVTTVQGSIAVEIDETHVVKIESNTVKAK
jgi:transcription antitermination factor NusG